jgi:hypothetical protein
MAKKPTSPPFKIAPLQRIVAEPMTDPDEIAAFMKARARGKAGLGTKNGKTARDRAAKKRKA